MNNKFRDSHFEEVSIIYATMFKDNHWQKEDYLRALANQQQMRKSCNEKTDEYLLKAREKIKKTLDPLKPDIQNIEWCVMINTTLRERGVEEVKQKNIVQWEDGEELICDWD